MPNLGRFQNPRYNHFFLLFRFWLVAWNVFYQFTMNLNVSDALEISQTEFNKFSEKSRYRFQNFFIGPPMFSKPYFSGVS